MIWYYKEYADGIAFLDCDDKEVAFYSYFTKQVEFNKEAYPGSDNGDYGLVPYHDIGFIVDTVQQLKKIHLGG